MKAVQITRLDGPTAIEFLDVENPKLAHDQVLINVRAAGAGFPVLLRSHGLYHEKPALPFTAGSEFACTGFEFAGIVVEAPKDSGLVVGDRVAAIAFFQGPDHRALPTPDGFAQQAVAAVDMKFVLPDAIRDSRQARSYSSRKSAATLRWSRIAQRLGSADLCLSSWKKWSRA